MIGHDLGRTPPPLAPAVDALLSHERVIDPVPEMVRARALTRAREALQSGQVVPLGFRRSTPRIGASPLRRLLYAAAAGVVLMAGAAAAYQMLRRPTPVLQAPPAAPSVTRPAHGAPPTPVASPEPAAEAPAVAPPSASPSQRSTATGRGEARQEELRLLVRARRADARGDYATVLTLLAEHERSYPNGRLVEERQVLRVKALVGLHRGTEARQLAAKFRREFPRSVLLHKIEDMLASLR
jgi:hypothetical protein